MAVQQQGLLKVRIIEGQDKIALIDTGAGRCCMNEEQYETLGSPSLEPVDVGFQL